MSPTVFTEAEAVVVAVDGLVRALARVVWRLALLITGVSTVVATCWALFTDPSLPPAIALVQMIVNLLR